jgi:hypothetical protein
MFEDCGGANFVHALAIGITEQLPGIPQIFEEAVAVRADRGAARTPLARDYVNLGSDHIELRAALEHRNHGALGGLCVAFIGCQAAERSPFGQVGGDVGGLVTFWRTAPVARLINRNGIPVGVSNAGAAGRQGP